MVMRGFLRTGLILGVWLTWSVPACGGSGFAIEPDLAHRHVADRQVVEKFGPEARMEYLRGTVEQEVALLEMSTVVAYGSVVTTYGPDGGFSGTVVFAVDECLRGDCRDTLEFGVLAGLVHGATYQTGERAIVVLGGESSLWGSGESQKYLIQDGTVVRKGIPAEQLLREMRDVFARRSPESLYRAADVLAVGQVDEIVDEYSYHGEEPGENFLTLRLREVLKGDVSADRIRINLPKWPSLRRRDKPDVRVGEECALFLSASGDNTYELTGGCSSRVDTAAARLLARAAAEEDGASTSPN
jgi:hypothetical protein